MRSCRPHGERQGVPAIQGLAGGWLKTYDRCRSGQLGGGLEQIPLRVVSVANNLAIVQMGGREAVEGIVFVGGSEEAAPIISSVRSEIVSSANRLRINSQR